LENLYLGSVGAAYNFQVLQQLKISSILTVCECLPPKFPNDFEYKVIQVTDEPSVKLSLYFKEATDFIRKAINEGKGVLVHCFAGVSRSASIVIAYLIKYHKMEFNSAFNYVKNKRPWINPNYGFQAQLRRYCIYLKDQKLKGFENS
jgi:protein-tyrosine phosphatase